MTDAKLGAEHFLNAAADRLCVGEGQVFAEVDVCLKVDVFIVHLPDVQVVHVLHLSHPLGVLLHVVQVYLLGRGLHKDVDRLADDAPGVPDDVDAHGHGDQRVEPIELPDPNGDAAEDDGHGRERVAQEVQVSRADVQVALLVAVQDDDRDQVSQQPEGGHRQHHGAADRFRVQEALVSLDEEEDTDDDQRDGVEECRQDLGAFVTKRFAQVGTLLSVATG